MIFDATLRVAPNPYQRTPPPRARYRGLSAVMAGIVPKMSVRFSAFETYKGWLGADGQNKGERNTLEIAGRT